MSNFLDKILYIGILNSDTLNNRRAKRYLNTVLLVSLSTFPYAIYGFIHDGFSLSNVGGNIVFASFLVILLCYFLQWKGNFLLSATIYLFSLSLLFTSIAWAYGPGVLTEYFILVGIIMAFILFESAQYIAYIFALQAFISFVGLKILFLHYEPIFTYDHADFFVISNSALLVLCIFMSIWHYRRESSTYLSLMQNRNDKLDEANHTKDKFMSIISHDLIGPFSSMMKVLEILDDPNSNISTPKRQELLSKITNESKNYYHLLDNLLLWSRTQSNRIIVDNSDLQLNFVIQSVIDEFESSALLKNISIKANLQDLCNLSIDKNMFSTILRNLLSNAIKFTPSNGQVEIHCIHKDHSVYVTVKDNGIGIPLQKQRSIFQSIYVESSPGTENEKGSGLGLSICKEFVKLMGGKIWVDSNENEGTSFTFTFPVELADQNT